MTVDELRLHPEERAALDDLIRRATCPALPPLAFAVLFGSKARGDFHDASDLDVLFVCDTSPSMREAADAALAAQAREVEAMFGVPVEPWVITTTDLEEGRRTPMLIDALDDGVMLWPIGVPPLRLPFTPADACFCAGRLLEWVEEGGPIVRRSLAEGRLADAAHRARDDITRLATGALLLLGDTRHRRDGTLRRFEHCFVSTGIVAPAVLPALAWAERAFPERSMRGAESPPVTPFAIGTADQGCALAGVMEECVAPWIMARMRALESAPRLS